MDNSNDKTVKEKAATAETDVLRQRRRVIQGMAALPAMLTLKNGQAQAVASNLLCIEKNATILEADLNDSGSPNYNPVDINNRHCILAADATPITPYRPGVYDTGPGTAVRTYPNDTNLGGINYTSPQQACVVYVDANGTIVNYDASQFDGVSPGLHAPVTSSCYASFTPA